MSREDSLIATIVSVNGSTFDDVDRAVFAALEHDPRMTISALGEAVGVSRHVAQLRLARLIEGGFLRIRGQVDPAWLGRPVVAMLRVVVVEDPHLLAKELAAHPSVNWVALLGTGNELLATVAEATSAALAGFIDQVIRSRSDVNRVFVDLIVSVIPALGPDDDIRPRSVGVDSVRELDGIDGKIVEELRLDGRASYSRLAEVSGLSVASARQRAIKLLESGVVTVRAAINPDVLGLTAVGVAHIQIAGDSTEAAIQIARLPGITYVNQVLGSTDVYAEFIGVNRTSLLGLVRALSTVGNVTSWSYHQYEEVTYSTPLWV